MWCRTYVLSNNVLSNICGVEHIWCRTFVLSNICGVELTNFSKYLRRRLLPIRMTLKICYQFSLFPIRMNLKICHQFLI